MNQVPATGVRPMLWVPLACSASYRSEWGDLNASYCNQWGSPLPGTGVGAECGLQPATVVILVWVR